MDEDSQAVPFSEVSRAQKIQNVYLILGYFFNELSIERLSLISVEE